jgi:RNA polymerase sigma-70 factor (ECF subfamily)
MNNSDLLSYWIKTHTNNLHQIAYKLVGNTHSTEDIVQETFKSAWDNIDSYDRTLNEKYWLTTILKRRVVDYWRKKRSRGSNIASGSEYSIIAPKSQEPSDLEYSTEINNSLDSINPLFKESFLLVEVEGLTHPEAALKLGVPVGTVLSRVHRARTQLRVLLTV